MAAPTAAEAGADPWSSRQDETWSELIDELRSSRPLQRRLAALRWWLSRWRDPGFRRHVLLPLDQHAPRAVALVSRVVMVGLAYVVLHTLFPRDMAPGHMLWITCLVWLVAYHIGELFEAFHMPKSLGMMLSGVVLRSMGGTDGHQPPLYGLDLARSRNIRAGAMALVFLRTGIGINLRTIRAGGPSLLALVTLPSMLESLVTSFVARYFFHMPYMLALTLSFMVAAVGPGALSAGCASVKERGYAPRAPNFLMTSMCFDDVTCIVFFNCLLHAYLAGGDVSSGEAWGYKTVLLALLVGTLGGLVASAVVACTAVWCTPARRSGVLLLCCAMNMYVAMGYEQTGTGAIANLMLGLGTRHAWRRGWPFPMLSIEHRANVPRAATHMLLATQHHLSDVWHSVMYPLLFGFLGASFDVSPGSGAKMVSLPRACLFVFVAIVARITVTALVTFPMRRFTRRERLYIALAWCTKSTMQAAFATVPRHLIVVWLGSHPKGSTLHGASADELTQWGEDIHGCCVMSALISTAIGTILVNSSPYFLLARRRTGARTGVEGGISDADMREDAEAVDGAAGGEDDDEWSIGSSLPELFVPFSAAEAAKLRRFYSAGAQAGGPVTDVASLEAYVSPLLLPAAPAAPAAPRDDEGDGDDVAASPSRDSNANSNAEAAAAAAAGALPAPQASLVFTLSNVPAAQLAAVRGVLLAAGARLTDLLPGGAAVQLLVDEPPTSTHPNVFEDPNEEAPAAAGSPVAAGGAPDGAVVELPPSARRRAWRRAVPCGAAAAPAPAPRPRLDEADAAETGTSRPRSSAMLEFSRAAQPGSGDA